MKRLVFIRYVVSIGCENVRIKFARNSSASADCIIAHTTREKLEKALRVFRVFCGQKF